MEPDWKHGSKLEAVFFVTFLVFILLFMTTGGSNENKSFERIRDDSNHSKGTANNQTPYETTFINSTKSSNLTEKLHRVQFAHRGRCVGISRDNSLVVSRCHPTAKQAFFFSNGILKSDETLLCVGLINSSQNELGLLECTQAICFTLVADKLLHKTADREIRCISHLLKMTPTSGPELGAAIALTRDCEWPVSKIRLLNETLFLILIELQ